MCNQLEMFEDSERGKPRYTSPYIGYGFFIGGDPRKFHPDEQCCSEQEIALHKAHCELWDKGEYPDTSLLVGRCSFDDEGRLRSHIQPSGYGLGSYEYDEEDEPNQVDELISTT